MVDNEFELFIELQNCSEMMNWIQRHLQMVYSVAKYVDFINVFITFKML